MKHLKKIKISSGTAPYSYTWSGNSSCITFDKPTGVTEDGEVEVNITVNSEACYTSNNVRLAIVDNNGCEKVETFTLVNPCLTFINPTIHYNGIKAGQYNFTCVESGGSAPYTYYWTYPKDIFNVAGSPTEKVLRLSLTKNSPFVYNTAYPITVTVTDGNGCIKTNTYNYTFCRPIASDFSVAGECGGCGTGWSVRTVLDLTKQISYCSGTTIDWSNLVLSTDEVTLESTYTYTNINGIVTICIDIVALGQAYDLVANNNQLKFNFSVKDSTGTYSTVGAAWTSILDCTSGKSAKCLTTFPFTLQTDCSWSLPHDELIPLLGTVPLVVEGSNPIDWSTFTFEALPGQTLTNPTRLELPSSGYVELDINKNFKVHLASITYNPSELIRWKVCDTGGCCSKSTSTIIELACLEPPVAADDEYCVDCGNQVTFDITDNDTGSISNSSVINITQVPTQGVVVVSGITLNYTANPNYFGADVIKYTITDDNGLTSNEATIAITIACAGNPENIINCNP